MIEYRKHKSGREFYRIDGDMVIRVLNKEKQSRVDVCDNWIIKETAIDCSFPSTEQEFKEELQVALERINKMKV